MACCLYFRPWTTICIPLPHLDSASSFYYLCILYTALCLSYRGKKKKRWTNQYSRIISSDFIQSDVQLITLGQPVPGKFEVKGLTEGLNGIIT